VQLAQAATTLLSTFGSFRDAYNNGELVGKGLALKGVLASASNLPTTGMVIGDAYLIGTVLNVWSGTVWKTSDIQGAKGDKGDQGIQGIQGIQGLKGDQGLQGVKGDQGLQGVKGDTGATGPANVLSVGTVTSGATPSATISGTTPNQVLNLVLQKGDKGDKGDQGIPDPAGTGTLNSVSATAPVISTGGTDPVISMPAATNAASGYLDKTDWATFNGKEPAVAAGNATDYYSGNKTWANLATAVRAVVLTGLSTATNAAVTATDTVLVAIGKLQKQITDAVASINTKAKKVTFLDKGSFASGTAAITVSDAGHQKITATGNITLSLAGWDTSGNTDELLIECVNFGGKTIAFPTINWVKSDGSFTTTFASNGVTLQSAGTDFILVWTRDSGTTIYGKVVR
jgi:hypothetical protein